MNDNYRLGLQIIFWLALAATVYTYAIYPLLLWVWTKFKTSSNIIVQDDIVLPTITMVVSAYNEQDIIAQKIINCQQLDYPAGKIKFLIGSDGSDDNTNNILSGIDDSRFSIILAPQRRGKVSMLNFLLPMAQSDIVVFSDANTMYATDALKKLQARFDDEKIGIVIGKLELSAGDENACQPEGLYWRYENKIKAMESIIGAVPTVNGGIFAIRRDLFVPLPENAITEDQVLAMLIMGQGYRCVFAEDAKAGENVADWQGELRRRIRISAGNFQSLFLAPAILNPFCGRVSFAFYSHKFLRWMVPFFLIAMLGANILLAGQAFYGATMLMQIIFYGCGFLGSFMPKLTGVLKLLSIPAYFITMNFAILLGFARFIRKKQKVTWAKTRNVDAV